MSIMDYRYKVVNYKESLKGAILFGSSVMDTKKIEDAINAEAKQGWRLVSQIVEHGKILFWSREVIILTFEKPA